MPDPLKRYMQYNDKGYYFDSSYLEGTSTKLLMLDITASRFVLYEYGFFEDLYKQDSLIGVKSIYESSKARY